MKNTLKKIAEVLEWLFTPIPEAYQYMNFVGRCEYRYY